MGIGVGTEKKESSMTLEVLSTFTGTLTLSVSADNLLFPLKGQPIIISIISLYRSKDETNRNLNFSIIIGNKGHSCSLPV